MINGINNAWGQIYNSTSSNQQKTVSKETLSTAITNLWEPVLEYFDNPMNVNLFSE